MTAPREMSVADASRELGVSMETTRRWAKADRLTILRRVPGGHGYIILSATSVERVKRERSES